MEQFFGWIWGFISIVIVTTIGVSRSQFKKLNDMIEDLDEKNDKLSERVTVVECNLITEREVRNIMKECIDPVAGDVKEIQKSTRSMELILARMPKREND